MFDFLFGSSTNSSEVVHTMTSLELKEILKKNIKWNNPIEPFLADKEYIIPSIYEVKNALIDFKIKPYIENVYDCDNRANDFASLFHGKTVGEMYIVYSYNVSHAINFFVDNKKQIWYIDTSPKYMKQYYNFDFAYRGRCI